MDNYKKPISGDFHCSITAIFDFGSPVNTETTYVDRKKLTLEKAGSSVSSMLRPITTRPPVTNTSSPNIANSSEILNLTSSTMFY